jgi:hypothetical protein
MSAYSLTPASEQAVADAMHTSMTVTLELQASTTVAWATLCTEHAGDQLEAVITYSASTNSLTLAAGNDGHTQQLADYIEAIVSGTADTAQEPTAHDPLKGYTPIPLAPCNKCGKEAIGYSYLAAGNEWAHGVKCRYNACQTIDTQLLVEQAAADPWNAAMAGSTHPAAADMVNHPPHYTGHPSGVECIDVAEELPFNLGNAFKYVFRYRGKGGRQDLEKARWYLLRQMASDPDAPDELGFCAGELVAKIAQHESYPVGRALVCIAHGGVDLPEALEHIEHLLKAA